MKIAYVQFDIKWEDPIFIFAKLHSHIIKEINKYVEFICLLKLFMFKRGKKNPLIIKEDLDAKN